MQRETMLWMLAVVLVEEKKKCTIICMSVVAPCQQQSQRRIGHGNVLCTHEYTVVAVVVQFKSHCDGRHTEQKPRVLHVHTKVLRVLRSMWRPASNRE